MTNSADNSKYITLSSLQGMIRRAIERGVPSSVWVVAQVSEAKLNYSGHFYIELVERSEDQRQSLAVARAVIWANTYKMIGPYFESVTAGKIGPGMQILVRCTVSYHAVYGLSLVVEDIDPTYTVGAVEVARQRTVARLKSEGVYDMNRQWELPVVVQRVALISSATAAGYQDFMNELQASRYRVDITLFHSTMQGEGAACSMVAALDAIAMRCDDFDAVVIIRGGGSVSDLSCFDDYTLCANIAQFPLPIITGIGHDKDVSASDMVANLSLKTPTAVAAALVGWCEEFDAELIAVQSAILSAAGGVIAGHVSRVENCARFLSSKVGTLIVERNMELQALCINLEHGVRNFCGAQTRMLDSSALLLTETATRMLKQGVDRLLDFELQLSVAARGVIAMQGKELDIMTLQVESSNPRRILSLGYAIVHFGANASASSSSTFSVKSVKDVSAGQLLSVELADGVVDAQVSSVREFKTRDRKTNN